MSTTNSYAQLVSRLLRTSAEFRDEHNHWMNSACTTHDDYDWRRRRIAGGGIQIARQCLRCGHIMSNPRKHSPEDIYLDEIDCDLNARYVASRHAELDAIVQKYAATAHTFVSTIGRKLAG